MIVDTSPVLAILFGEPEADVFIHALVDNPKRLMSSFNALESSIVVEARKGEAGGRELDLLLHRARVEIVSLSEEQVEIARGAWRKYGRGNHPAGLNIGDCCAYAPAKLSNEPHLFKGMDFIHTDVRPVLRL